MNYAGTFEGSIFGVGYFGVVQSATPVSATLITDQLESALSQEIENAQQIGTFVKIAGSDVSELVESVSVSSSENKITATATIVLVGSKPAALVSGASITVETVFRFEDGTEFTNVIFSGIVKSFQPSSGSTNQTVSVYAYDSAEAALSSAPKNTTWTGYASALIDDELSAAGLLIRTVELSDFSMSAVNISGFKTVRELIIGVVGTTTEAVAYVYPNGAFCAKSYFSPKASGLVFTQKSYTYFQGNSDDTNKFKVVSVTGSTGLSDTATGTGTIDYSVNSSLITDTSDCLLKASAIVSRAEKTKVTIQVPLNPLVKIGETISVYDDSNALKTVRVSGVSHYIQWTTPDSSPGAWTTITGDES